MRAPPSSQALEAKRHNGKIPKDGFAAFALRVAARKQPLMPLSSEAAMRARLLFAWWYDYQNDEDSNDDDGNNKF